MNTLNKVLRHTSEFPPDGLFITRVIDPMMRWFGKMDGIDCFLFARVCFWLSLASGIGSMFIWICCLISAVGGESILNTLWYMLVMAFYSFLLQIDSRGLKSLGNGIIQDVYADTAGGAMNRELYATRWRFFMAVALLFMLVMQHFYLDSGQLLTEEITDAPFIFGYLAWAFMASTPRKTNHP